MSHSFVTSLTRPYERRALPKRNLPYYVWRFVGNGMRTYRMLTSPMTHGDTSEIARELHDQGIVVGPADRFLSNEGRDALARAAHRLIERSRSDEIQAVVQGAVTSDERKKDYLINLIKAHGRIPGSSPVLRVALDQKLLETVARYLGFWPRLHSIGAWLNYPTPAEAQASQLWHRDPEDLKLIKVFIYLEDVGEQNGPFTYIPKTHPFGSRAQEALACQAKRIDDKRMRRYFNERRWRVCTGPANTMILADTVGFHRGGKPDTGTRLLITFTYTSATPFVERPLAIKGRPEWATTPIQDYAIASAVTQGDAADTESLQRT